MDEKLNQLLIIGHDSSSICIEEEEEENINIINDINDINMEIDLNINNKCDGMLKQWYFPCILV